MKLFSTERNESFKTKVMRWGFNLFPSFRRAGGRVKFISDDYYEVHTELKLKWTTRNAVGSVFGGSIYASVDPIYMTQLMQILGKRYVVWDKAATVKFIKPIRNKVAAKFLITEAQVEYIKKEIEGNNKVEIEFLVEFVDKQEVVYASIKKLLYVADAAYYKNRKIEKVLQEHNNK